MKEREVLLYTQLTLMTAVFAIADVLSDAFVENKHDRVVWNRDFSILLGVWVASSILIWVKRGSDKDDQETS